MGKQGKSKSNGLGDRVRPAPYKKPTVEVRFEGEPSAATTKAKSSSAPAPAAVATAKPKPAKADAALPVKSEKAKGKERASPPTSTNVPGSFIVIAGSYEKLLYGIEGSYPTPEGQEDDGQVNKTVRPDFTPIFIFPAHLAFVKAIAASPGGKWLATGSEDEFIKVWDLRRRKEVGSLSQHTGSITSLHFPTSAHLLSTSVDGTISLFRTSDWSLLKSLKGHSGRVNYVDVHPTGRVALSVGKDLTLKMWDLMRGRGAASLSLGSEAEQVKFSPLGTHFAVLFPKKIEIYSLSLALLHTLETKSRFNSILFAEVDLDGLPVELLCVGTEKGVVEVYDVDIVDADEDEDEGGDKDSDGEDEEKGGQVAEVERIGTLVGHTNRVKSISALAHTIPADPPLTTTLLSSVSSDGLINLYDLAQVFEHTDKGEENKLDPVGSYDTKGSRLTCCFLADGRKERLAHASVTNGKAKPAGGRPTLAATDATAADDIADMDDAEDEEDDAEGMYDSAQEEDEEDDEDGEEDEDGNTEEEGELEEEAEDEEEGEYE